MVLFTIFPSIFLFYPKEESYGIFLSMFGWFLRGVNNLGFRNPLTRCGLHPRLAQEMSDQASSDLDRQTKRWRKKGWKEERRCGRRET